MIYYDTFCGNITVERWTQGAIDCYKRCCICRDCPTKELMRGECKMKYAVIESVKKLGKPKGIRIKTFVKD